jgi:hypothetical protein
MRARLLNVFRDWLFSILRRKPMPIVADASFQCFISRAVPARFSIIFWTQRSSRSAASAITFNRSSFVTGIGRRRNSFH